MAAPAAFGAVTGTVVGGAVAWAARGQTLVPWPDRVRTAFPFVLGGLAGSAVGLSAGVKASLVAAMLGKGRGPVTTWTPVVVGGVLAAGAVAGGMVGRDVLLSKLSNTGRAIDAGFATPPADPLVSGSVDSAVPLASLGREGARFVGTMTGPEDAKIVLGEARIAEPVRVFVGVDAAPTVEARVLLAMAELRRTGAFDRSVLLIQAPAGSGYANATPSDVLEILTKGDTATVSIGYGLLPSFLSLDAVALAARTQRLLIEAIAAELGGRERRPRLLAYGESLGAKVQQAAIPGGLVDLDHFGIDAALWVGTPGGSASDQFHAGCAASSITVDRPEQIPATFEAGRPRVWFLEHDGDPVVRFRPDLAWQRPAWLAVGKPRGRNIPPEMTWKPAITWAQGLVDTLFATNIKPGDFQSRGHDYRADLGAVVTAAFGFSIDTEVAERLDARLRELEVQRAARIAA